MRKNLITALLLMGFTGTAAQIILIRELLVTFYGNELFIGVILGNWIILEAAGSFFSSRTTEVNGKSIEKYISLQILIAVCLPLAVLGARVIKGLLGIPPGEMVGLFTALSASLFLLAPLSLANGAHFTIGCRLYSGLAGKTTASITRVYIFESIGALAGGLILAFLVIPYFHSMEIAFVVGALNLASAVLLAFFYKKPLAAYRREGNFYTICNLWSARFALPFIGIILLASSIYLIFSSGADKIHEFSIQEQWQGFDLKLYRNSNYGNIVVTESEDEYTFYSGGIPITTTPFPDETFVEELAHLPLLFHHNPNKMLIVAGGFGGLINEALKHPVEEIHYVELDPMIIETAHTFVTALSEYELNNPRVDIHYSDGRYFINHSRESYDLIIINLPSPSSFQLNRFYTREFFELVQKRLKSEGILALTCPGSESYISKELADLNACLYLTLQDSFPYIKVIPGETNIFLASTDPAIMGTEASVLNKRRLDRALETSLLSDFHIDYKLDRSKEEWFLLSLKQSAEVRINHDLSSSGLYYNLLLWSALAEKRFENVLRTMGKTKLWHFLLLIAFLMLSFIYFKKKFSRLNSASAAVAVITTGFAGIAFELALILAFQSFYGYVFQMIALLTAFFMIGLAAGSTMITCLIERITDNKKFLLKLESAITGYAFLMPALLFFISYNLHRPVLFAAGQAIIFLLSFSSGILVGAEFPLANRIYLSRTHRVGAVGGGLYAADLLGAWFGALTVSIWLIPVLGIVNTCILVGCFKAASLVLVATSKLPGLADSTKAGA